MFGGLSIKGEAKEELGPAPAASSGFSFLQSSIGAPAAAAAPSAPSSSAAASNDNASSESALGMLGSAFGFMSGTGGNGGGGGGGRGESAAPVSAPAPPPQQSSMFAGLTASSAREPSAAAAVSEPAAAPPPGSGFAFLSAPSPPQPTAKAAVLESSNASAATAPPGSGFAFLSAPSAPTAALAAEPSDGVDAASTSSAPAVSSFGFMGGAGANGGDDDGGGEGGSPPAARETASAPAGGASGFSFLPGGAAAAPPSEAASPTAGRRSPSIPGGSPRPDLLSLSNPGILAGSGVSWSAPPVGAAKRVVKKKRGRRVGVGSAAASGKGAAELPPPNSIPEPAQPPSFRPPSVPGDAPPPHPSTPRRSVSAPASSDPDVSAQPNSLTPMRVKAERATDAADEFIREKQRKSAIAMAAERAMQDRGGGTLAPSRSLTPAGSDDGWQGAIPSMPSSPTDETYRAAKAAATEARTLAADSASQPKGKGKASLFGNFFHRGKGKGGGPAGIASRSSHGGVVASPPPGGGVFQRGASDVGGGGDSAHGGPLTPMRENPEIPSYGSPPAAISSYGSPPAATGGVAPGSGGAGGEDANARSERERRAREEFERGRREEASAAEARRREQDLERSREREEELERSREREEERLRRQSPRVKMHSAVDRLADSARASAGLVAEIGERRAALAAEGARAGAAERRAGRQLDLAEGRQAAAAEEEDFEAADGLAAVIEGHARERAARADERGRIEGAVAGLDREGEAASGAVAACFRAAREELKALEEEVDDRGKEVGVLDRFATTSKRLSSETERLANDLKHIERDENVWEEESKELGGQIEGETKEFEEERSEASKKLEEVNKTMKDLRKQLSEAESRASELNTEIASHINSVQTVRSKYSRQLGRLKKKEQSVKESRRDWESERESVEKAKAAHGAVVAAHSEDMLSRESLIEDVRSEASVAGNFEGVVSAAFAGAGGAGAIAAGDPDGEVLRHEAAADEARRNVLAAEADVRGLEEELAGIVARVPVLEAEKRAAASRRDFKAAGRASREMKDASARGERCAAELSGGAAERWRLAEDGLERILALLEEERAVAAGRRKEAGRERMELLRGKIDELRSILKSFATPDSEKFATEKWGKDGEDAITVSCVGAFVIESRIFVLEAEGRSLGEKYGGWASDVVEDSSVQSAPTFDSADDENESEVVIDKSLLEKYISMRNEMKDLEGAIEQAADEENFDKAAELEERAQTLRVEFESAGFTTEKFEMALKGFMQKTSGGAGGENSENNVVSSKSTIDESVLEEYSSICADIKELEASIEMAVAEDDFDKAAELEEEAQSARLGVESLGFSNDDLERALKNRLETAGAAVAAADTVKNCEDSFEMIDENVLDKYASLCAVVKKCKAAIESAEADEETAGLEDRVRSAQSDIASLCFPVDDLEEALKSKLDAENGSGAGGKKEEYEGDASPDDGRGGDDEEKCTEELNGDEKNAPHDDVKTNGESAQQEKESVNNTDGAEEEEC